jgi:hypothetical protein
MQDSLATRLESLREEYQTGENMLADLEAKELHVRQTLLRIAGAIQVLEEILADTDGLAARSAGTTGTSGETPDTARRPTGRVIADQPSSPADPAQPIPAKAADREDNLLVRDS